MKISASPCSRWRSRSRLRYCAWMVRSRLVVGSSAISRRGSQEMPIAPTMRWRMPPDISCGNCLTRVSGEEMRTDLSRRTAPAQALATVARSWTRSGSPTYRVLQDHGDALATHAAHLRVRLVEQVLAFEHHPPADDARRRRQQAHDGEGERAFARARFPDDAEGFSRAKAKRHVVDRAHDARALLRDVVSGQMFERQQRFR